MEENAVAGVATADLQILAHIAEQRDRVVALVLQPHGIAMKPGHEIYDLGVGLVPFLCIRHVHVSFHRATDERTAGPPSNMTRAAAGPRRDRH